MKNPFKVGKEAPGILDEMYAPFDWLEIPGYLDGNDFLSFGIRGNKIPDKKTSNRLFRQLKDCQKDSAHPLFISAE